MAFSLMLGRRPCLPARHAVQFTFRVNRAHRMNPLNDIACMRFQEVTYIAQCRYYFFYCTILGKVRIVIHQLIGFLLQRPRCKLLQWNFDADPFDLSIAEASMTPNKINDMFSIGHRCFTTNV